MMIAVQQCAVLLGAGDDAWIRLIVPVVIVIAYVLSAIGKSRGQNQEQEDGQAETPQPPVRRERVPQQPTRLPRQEPRPITQRPIPVQRIPGPQRTMRTQPVPTKSTSSERHPREVFDRVNKPISTAEPASVEKLEHSLEEKLKRVEKIQPDHVLRAEQVVEAALKPTVIPTQEVEVVEIVEEVDITEIEIDLQNPNKLREAILFREILDKPLALR